MLTALQLKTLYLRGLPLEDEKGRPLPDANIEFALRTAAKAFERKHAIRLTPRIIVMGTPPLEPLSLDPSLPLEKRAGMDSDPRDFEGNRWLSLKLPIGPFKELLYVGLSLPGGRFKFSSDWWQMDPRRKTLQLYPKGKELALQALSGWAMVSLSSGRTIPQGWEVVYLAGYTPSDLQGQDEDVDAIVGKLATLELLIPGSIDRFLARGLSGVSVGVDGLSQSTQLMQNPNRLKFAALMDAYAANIAAWEATYGARKSGLKLGFV